MRALKERATERNADLLVVWVSVPTSVCYERMKKRNLDRDILKLSAWEEYVKKVDYTPPYTLVEKKAVDALFVFDNTNEDTARKSLKNILKELGEKSC